MSGSAPNRYRASVVVPVRNRPDLLRAALRSLLAQDLDDGAFEILVCDDGSREDVSGPAADVVSASGRKVALRILSLAPRGPAAARNQGIRAAQADVVFFVDSDVEVAPGCLRALVEALDRRPDWLGAEARLKPTGGEDGLLWDAPASDTGGRYHTAAIAYRREVLRAVGGFDETFKLPACEDVEIAMRILRHGPIGFVLEAIAFHPRRRVTASTHLRWRKHWRYEMVLAVRYGILAFPGRPAGRYPRLRVLWAATVTLPAGRGLRALRHFPHSPGASALAAWYALIDFACSVAAAPSILFSPVPPRLSYVSDRRATVKR